MIEDQSTLDEIGSVVAGGGQAPAIAKRIAQVIRLAGGYGCVSIYAVTETEIVALGWTGTEEPAHMRFPVTRGLTGVVVKTGRTLGAWRRSKRSTLSCRVYENALGDDCAGTRRRRKSRWDDQHRQRKRKRVQREGRAIHRTMCAENGAAVPDARNFLVAARP